jgi:hypothetical protein
VAYITQGALAIFGVQSGYGSVNATIRDFTGAVGLTDGLFLGDPTQGIAKSGISLALKNTKADAPIVSSSFTRQFAPRLSTDISKFSIAMPIGGKRTNASGTPVDGDADFSATQPGVYALWRSAGLLGANWGAGVGWALGMTDVLPVTAKVWIGSGSNTVAVVLYDLIADLTLKFDSKKNLIGTWEFSGKYYSHNKGETIPSPTYGVLASVSPPVILNAAAAWGHTRGGNAMTLKVGNSITTFDDWNSTTGDVSSQEGRIIELDANIQVDTTDESYDVDRLHSDSATTDDFTMQIGAVMTAGNPVNGVRLEFNNPDHSEVEFSEAGGKFFNKLKASASATSANAEASIIFN